jgi:hypothetical protein
MIKLVDTLTLYTLENGALTCVATTASLICWLKMNNNLVFLGLHFMITKLYANSLLASLNTRKELTKRQRRNNGSPYENEHSGSMQAVSTAQFVSPQSPRRAHALALQVGSRFFLFVATLLWEERGVHGYLIVFIVSASDTSPTISRACSNCYVDFNFLESRRERSEVNVLRRNYLHYSTRIHRFCTGFFIELS